MGGEKIGEKTKQGKTIPGVTNGPKMQNSEERRGDVITATVKNQALRGSPLISLLNCGPLGRDKN